jgi:thiol:disulfide interchange protein
MKQTIIIALFFAILLGCSSSRKVKKEKLEYTNLETKTVTKEKDGVYVATGEVNYKVNQNDYTIEPVDNSKPMKVDGKEYVNAKLKGSKKEQNLNVKNKDSTAIKEKESTEQAKKEKIDLEAKESEKKGQSILLLYFGITGVIILIVYVLIFLYRRYKTKNPLY